MSPQGGEPDPLTRAQRSRCTVPCMHTYKVTCQVSPSLAGGYTIALIRQHWDEHNWRHERVLFKRESDSHGVIAALLQCLQYVCQDSPADMQWLETELRLINERFDQVDDDNPI